MHYIVLTTSQAKNDISNILKQTRNNWGEDSEDRYVNLLRLAFRFLEAEPYAVGTHLVEVLPKQVRRLPLRNISQKKIKNRVKKPPHVIYFRIILPKTVLILRVLHDRMEPGAHLKDTE